MKRKSIVWLSVTLTLAAALASTGCDLGDLFGSKDGDTPTDNATVKVYDGKREGKATYILQHIDLENPDAPSSTGTDTDWDIMITGQKEILTNSGVTATDLSSGGKGGVVFSGKTDMEQGISVAEAAALFAKNGLDYTDYSFWDKYKTSSATPTSTSTGNAISFPGYTSQAGRDGQSETTAWVFGDVGDHVDVDFSLGTAYAKWERMDPKYSDFTNNVYVVRSGDGASYYKLQIADVVYSKTTDSSGTATTHYTFKIKFQKLG